jgi:nanoRNase/pAp phosphatase (c-di-AMP/oligoRNAs hydrolase)
MENIIEAKRIIENSKNIYLITSQEPEAVTSTLALFYTLKELGKNVNLVIDSLPENLKFLSPSIDFISYPKNFVISIPSSVAQISQIYYEKNNEAVKVHLTLENGNIKKDNIAFYFSEPKPDLIITIGVKDYLKELSGQLDSFGFLLDSPILNIDNGQENKKFGRINILGDTSITEIISALIKKDGSDILNSQTAKCLLSGLILYTANFKKNLNAEIFQTVSDLIKKGADIKEITDNIENSKN